MNVPNTEVTDEVLDHYEDVTKRALAMAKKAPIENQEQANEIFTMVESYLKDAKFFRDKGEMVRSFGAIYYAHGWLDCGARLGVFKVTDSTLFTVDDE